jgi:hypothetical protein
MSRASNGNDETRDYVEYIGLFGNLRLDARGSKEQVDDGALFLTGTEGANRGKSMTDIMLHDGTNAKPVRRRGPKEILSVLVIIDSDRDIDISGKPGLHIDGDGEAADESPGPFKSVENISDGLENTKERCRHDD